MRVSIVVPVYKVEKYVERCLRSVTAQTYENIECICVNDGTPDNSFEVVKKYVDEHGLDKENISFKLVEHDLNKGLSEARNTGIQHASGEYVFFLDSDDALPSDAISNLVGSAIKRGLPDVIYGHTIAIDNSGKRAFFEPAALSSFLDERSILIGRLNNTWPGIACNKLVKRVLFTEHGKWFASGLLHEDELWCFEISTVINKLIYCPKETYIYYVGDTDSISRRTSSEKDFRDNITILERKLGYMDKVCAPEELVRNVYNLSYMFYLSLVRLHFPRPFRKECHKRLAAVIRTARKSGYGPLHTRWYARLAWLL